MLIFKIKNNLISTGLKLQLNCDIHQHNTSVNVLPSARSVGQKRISHTAEIWFNELPENVKNIETLSNFNRHVKQDLFNQRLKYIIFY